MATHKPKIRFVLASGRETPAVRVWLDECARRVEREVGRRLEWDQYGNPFMALLVANKKSGRA